MKQTSPNRWKQNNTNIVLWFKQYLFGNMVILHTISIHNYRIGKQVNNLY